MGELKKWKRCNSSTSPINALDDGCLMRILSFLSPLPDRFSAARVCCRWRYLASDPRMWLRVERSCNALSEPGVFSTIEDAVVAARPGDTILIATGVVHMACNIQIIKPVFLVGGGSSPEETVLVCPRGFDSALEFLSTGKVANLTIKAELGSCLLHRNGRLTVENCVLQCEEHPLEHLCCPIVSTADALAPPSTLSSIMQGGSSMSVIHTRIEGGAKAVLTNGSLTLQQNSGMPSGVLRHILGGSELVDYQDIADNHSFVFLWVGSAEGLEEGCPCSLSQEDVISILDLFQWGFRRVDDICLLKTNHENRDASEFVNNDRGALFKPTKEHCLMCIKNNIPPHLMHPNIDVDIIVSEEPPYGSTQKPEYLYRVIEHLIQGRRRIAIFGEDHNLQPGWLTVGNGLFSSNFSKENFADAEGNVWEGGYGCTASPNAPHLIGTTQKIEELRPKSPWI